MNRTEAIASAERIAEAERLADTDNAEEIRAVRVESSDGSCYSLRLYSLHDSDRLGYVFRSLDAPEDAAPLFAGRDFGPSPCHAIDSDACVLALLGFLSLRPGDTDDEYFADDSPAVIEWREGYAEYLSCVVAMAEEPDPETGETWSPISDL